VLSTPPAFVLSQDQTLQQKPNEEGDLTSPKKLSQQKTIDEAKQNWHWHYKHPVEFSNNHHTPSATHLVGRIGGD
jgi:hypothetical protein